MVDSAILSLNHLNFILPRPESIQNLDAILRKIDKCCEAVKSRVNLADVIYEGRNFDSLVRLFGDQGIDLGIQIIVRLALFDFSFGSFTFDSELSDQGRLAFLRKSFGRWAEYEIVLCLKQGPSCNLINPRRVEHWEGIRKIEEGSLMTFYLRTASGKRIPSQERAAIAGLEEAFSQAQWQKDLPVEKHAVPVRPRKIESNVRSFRKQEVEASINIQVVINKIDTFIHAGNAHLVISHLNSYSGSVKMYVLRGEKVAVPLDPDSVWAKEIRNGETVVYEFFGPKPSDEFLRDLVNRTNKYTQMDKVANE